MHAFEPLDPVAFLRRSGLVHRDRLAVLDGDLRLTYGELDERVPRVAGALAALGVEPGDRVAVLAPNTHVLLEAHYGVPLAGAVLVALNVRLGPNELRYTLEHSSARVLICDAQLAELGRAANPGAELVLEDRYEAAVAGAAPLAGGRDEIDERAPFAINYTSGTTGHPKGVMYHRRGAYLQAVAMALHTRLTPDSRFLWTLPMFHCNGWCFTWAVTAAGAAHLCLRRPDPADVWRAIREDGVTHLNAAPTVLAQAAWHEAAAPAPRPIHVATGGAPPAPALLARLAELNMHVTHLYGLTETFGPIGICDWPPEWDDLTPERQAELKARQGVANVVSEPLRVLTDAGDAPADGETMGEIAVRGNTVMLGYYRDDDATAAACPDGWLRTGDVGVRHPGGYVELRDRAKDVIISGGENIASVEVEQAIVSHPAVLEAAVVPVADERWGERPRAYVTLKPGRTATEEEIRAHVRERLARFKVPDRVDFLADLPKTATGKVQKFRLREEAAP